MEIKYCEHAPDWCMYALLVGLFIYETVVQDYAFLSLPYMTMQVQGDNFFCRLWVKTLQSLEK